MLNVKWLANKDEKIQINNLLLLKDLGTKWRGKHLSCEQFCCTGISALNVFFAIVIINWHSWYICNIFCHNRWRLKLRNGTPTTDNSFYSRICGLDPGNLEQKWYIYISGIWMLDILLHAGATYPLVFPSQRHFLLWQRVNFVRLAQNI